MSDVDLSLGFDGKNCRGWMTYIESQTRLRLDGVLRGDTLILREIAPNDETSGYLRGTFQKRKFDADWSNYNGTLGGRLESEEVNVQSLGGVSHCGDNKWLNRYATKLNGGAVEVSLLRANNGFLTGQIWLDRDRKTYNLKGEINDDGDYSLDITRADGQSQGKLKGSMQYLQNLEAMWETTGGGKQFFNFSLLETRPVGCYESADFSGGWDVIYPKTKSNSCNTWFERQVGAWVSTCKNHFSKNQPDATPQNRAARRASAWPEIVFWSDNFYCGILTCTESWEEQPHGKAFNFDLAKNREILLEDIFIKNFEAKTWLEAQAKKQAPWLNGSDRVGLRPWLDQVGFPFWNLTREGIEMSSPFHPMFGRQRVLVAWDLVKPYLRKDSFVLNLI